MFSRLKFMANLNVALGWHIEAVKETTWKKMQVRLRYMGLWL